MKRYSLFTIIFSLILLHSCQDYLNVKPANVATVGSYADIRALMGAHLRMFSEGSSFLGEKDLRGVSLFYDATNDYLITHFYSDDYNPNRYLENWTGNNHRGNFHKSLNWMHTDIHESLWSTHFDNIGFYNMILYELTKYPGANEEETNMVRAEAKFLRAWEFFRLVQFFSPYHEDKYGLPINTHPEEVSTYDKSRKTQTQNYAFIIAELEEILGYNTKPSDTYNIFFDKQVVHGLLAQLYLYKGDSGAKAPDDYAKAVEHAKKAMEGGRLSLDVISRVEEQKEEKFGFIRNTNYALLTFSVSDFQRYESLVAWPDWGENQYASDELYSLFPDSDMRKSINFGDDKEITKFMNRHVDDFYQCCFFTAAEMQLIIAEANARSGKTNEAETALKQFEASRYTNDYQRPAEVSLLQNILNERRKEFCFEYCMRWLDLTRIQKGWSRDALDKPEGGTYTLEDNDFRFCMPIPKIAELQNNKIEQNPGWGNF